MKFSVDYNGNLVSDANFNNGIVFFGKPDGDKVMLTFLVAGKRYDTYAYIGENYPIPFYIRELELFMRKEVCSSVKPQTKKEVERITNLALKGIFWIMESDYDENPNLITWNKYSVGGVKVRAIVRILENGILSPDTVSDMFNLAREELTEVEFAEFYQEFLRIKGKISGMLKDYHHVLDTLRYCEK